MVFSSSVFLFVFLPIVLLGYYIIPNIKLQNIWLFIMSLIFYGFQGYKFVLFFLLEIIVNWIVGLIIEKNRKRKLSKVILILGLTFNIGFLIFFKFSNVLLKIVNNYFSYSIVDIALPIGISFYTFQEISYIVDVYKGQKCQKNLFNLGLYFSFFPQLIAGPIVRYKDIVPQLSKRTKSIDNISNGFTRFCTGLIKKVLIANQLGSFVDYVFARNINELGAEVLWLAAISYTFQIFFDFSGYSDMAIGLAKMFGFKIKENFNYPYISKNFTEFWKRWHISLSTWFRDYVYIPLGGNKKGTIITIRNLIIVWFLTGIWHGSTKNFLVWGMIWGLLIIFEKFIFSPEKQSIIIKRLYNCIVLIFVIILWVIFRSNSITLSYNYILNMFNINSWIMSTSQTKLFLLSLHEIYIYLILAIIFSVPIYENISKKIKENKYFIITKYIVFTVLVIISISFIVSGSYNPFLYFQF